EQARECRDHRCRNRCQLIHTAFMPGPDNACDNRCRCRTRQPNKMLFINYTNLRIKSGKPQSHACSKDKSSCRAKLTKLMERPTEHNQSRRQTKGHHIRQAIVLLTKCTGCVRQPSHAPVHTIQNHGDEDGDGSVFETTVHGSNYGVEAGKKGPSSK